MAVVSFSTKMLGTEFFFFVFFFFLLCLSFASQNPWGHQKRAGKGELGKKKMGAGKIEEQEKEAKENKRSFNTGEEDKGKRAKREKETSCHYLGWISSAQGFLTAEQRERERRGWEE